MEPNKHQQLQKQQQQQQQQRQVQQQTAHSHAEARSCPNCGATVSPGMHFCEECGCPIDSNSCPHCHQAIDPGLALCPHCGKPIDSRRCSFCGSELEEGENFCSTCGNPRQGIICPECGTRNYRSFCRKCNHPLNEMANQSLMRVRNNPHVVKAKQLNAEIEELQQKILELASQTGLFDQEGNELPPDAIPVELNEEDRQLLSMYDELINQSSPTITTQAPPQPAPQTPPKDEQTIKQAKSQLKQALDDYQARVAEMQRAIDAMIPDPQDPPEVQRNFLCACQIETQTLTKTKQTQCMGWICNWCGCHHSNPSECCKPELGGKWIYQEVETISKIKNSTTVYI